MTNVLRFDEPLAARNELSGGKGANLAILTQRGFPVPPGFIVTAPAYLEFARSAADLLRDINTFAFEDPARLRAQCDRLRHGLERVPLPASLAEEVRTSLAHLGDVPCSVRSSSTLEDLATAAFAGQHDTFLNCIGIERILERIKGCYLSLWQDRAVAYRFHHGFGQLSASMAVVVQQMADCDVAGVAFTVNPVSGDMGEVVIDASYGLGESVVSGEEEVDHFRLDKASGALRDSTIAAKAHRVVSLPGGGTRTEPVPAADAARPCLNAQQLAELVRIAVKVEASYRFPQDIEWGLEGRRLHLLQARPITSIAPRWTRDESAERFPNVITPLMWDFVDDGFHRSLRYSFRLLGFPPFAGKWFDLHGSYVYGNQNAIELYLKRPALELGSLEALRAAMPQIREQFRWVQELPVLWSRDLDDYLVRIGEFMAEPLEGKDLPACWEFVRRVQEHGAQYFQPNIAISITVAGIYRLAMACLRLAVGEADARRLFDGLLSWSDTKTGLINRELHAMAAQIRSTPELVRLLAATPSREFCAQGMPARFPEFDARFRKFLRDHGHRENDFDMYQPTWIEAPWCVVDTLRLIMDSHSDRTPAQSEREGRIRVQQSEIELLQRVPPDLHFFYGEIFRLARAYTALDDLEHYQTTRLTLPMRRGLREVGRRLIDRGVVEESMDVFFARLHAMDDAVQHDSPSGWAALRESIRSAKAGYLEARGRRPEWVLGEAAAPSAGGAELSGLPGSPGRAEGPVCLVLGPEDFARFPKGAVLVARTTSPTWTPLFYSAAAVVTESGGPLSHGAVTAREMQIPAVMSVRDCMRRLTNGQRVRVDGTAGRVVVLDA